MKVAFRVDSSIDVGVGHLMRCLALAEELTKQKAEVLFVVRKDDTVNKRKIEAMGCSLIYLEEEAIGQLLTLHDYEQWGWKADAELTIKAISGFNPDWIIVDHYQIDAQWHILLKQKDVKICVIDDLANREYCCDLLIDQTFARGNQDYDRYLLNRQCVTLLGSEYAILRSVFCKKRKEAEKRRKDISGVDDILISMGGSDPDNLTGAIVDFLSDIEWERKPQVDLVVGRGFKYISELRQIIKKHPLDITLSIDVANIEEHMLNADLAIGACGTTTWERCCMGLPSLLITTAENQKLVAKNISEYGAGIYLGDKSDCYLDAMKENIQTLASDTKLLSKMTQKCMEIVDGAGVERVYTYLCKQ